MDELLKLIYGVFICALFAVVYLLYPKKSTEDNRNFNYGKCGTVPYSIKHKSNVEGNPELGKTIFKNNCTQCHAKNMKSDLTGPPLENSIKRWNNDTIKFGKYLNNSDEYLEKFKDKRILEMKTNYRFTANSHKYEFTAEEVNSLLFYIEGIVAY